MTDIATFVDRYINIWNEPDADRRRQTIRDLWQENARHLARTLEAVGHSGIETRVATAYEKWIKLRWEMLPAGGGEVISIGFDFLMLGEDGRISTGYQFIEA
jgi:hypothetical protein